MPSLKEIVRDFTFQRVLSHDTKSKILHVLAHYSDVIIPELAASTHRLVDATENTIYSWAMASIKTDSPDTHVKAIFPATELHIQKYEAQTRILVAETPELYQNVTLPFIKSIPAARLQWVRNILNGTSEADVVLHRDEDPLLGFVILPDMKWNGAKESLYWVAIINREDLLSLRSLEPCHLILLKRIRAMAYHLAKEKFDLDPYQLRLFVHYQPSYYHFHVHITAVSFADAPGVTAGQAHLLDSIIDMLTITPDYYQRATLPFVLGDRHSLYLSSEAWTQPAEE
ncbi:HIT-like domain-containing protein [Spinellus fusiger]|nr:HIT-like domain-containing protein [Spinellus fusiger]